MSKPNAVSQYVFQLGSANRWIVAEYRDADGSYNGFGEAFTCPKCDPPAAAKEEP